MGKLKFVENERNFAIYLYNKVRKSNENLQLGWGKVLSNDEILKEYDTDIQFKEFVDTQYIIRKKQYMDLQTKKCLAIPEILGPEGRTARQNKRNETLGPEGLSKSAKKNAETFKNKPDEYKKEASDKRRETYNARTEEQRLETKNKMNESYKDRSGAMEKRAVNMGAEKLTKSSQKSGMCLYEWSNGFISKGPGKKFVIDRFPGVYMIKMIRFDDIEHTQYFTKWEKEFKPKKKGTGKGNTDIRVICPDGYGPTTPSAASKYCRNRGLDKSKCVPVN